MTDDMIITSNLGEMQYNKTISRTRSEKKKNAIPHLRYSKSVGS